MNKTLAWVKLMENPGGGLAAWTDGGKAPSYPEVTGYTIPTLYDYGEKELAGRCADWLCKIQHRDGWWTGIHTNTAQTFDTSAILEGLTRAFLETKEDRYIAAANKARQWLLAMRDKNGTLPTEPGKPTQCYTARAAWIVGDLTAAEYWLPYKSWDERWGSKQRPHYIAYLLEGLHNLGYDITRVLEGAKHITGLFPFYSLTNWIPADGTDTSATIQMAILYKKNKMSIDHLLPAINMMVTECGGLKHSASETRMTIWTAKYYLDLLRLI